MNSTVVELKDLGKEFSGLSVLRNINLAIAPGEILGLFGHNGAGKSTLMKICLGVVKPSSGSVLVMGHSPTANDSHHYRCQFGYLPENVSFYDQLSGQEVLNYFSRLKGSSKKDVERLLEEVGLAQVAGRAVKTYSKGMRQRLGLAQALLGEPKLLLLDEPTIGLDPVATNDFYSTVDRLKSGGCAVILCSHVLPGVESHIDRAMILNQGQQLALGTLEELRIAASLPVEIDAYGLTETDFTAVLADNRDDRILQDRQPKGGVASNGVQRLLVPQDQKLTVLRRLVGCTSLKNIELRQPSLETLYRHYTASTNDSDNRAKGHSSGEGQ